MDEKYLKDYTTFIKLAEETTGMSPSRILDHYKLLVEELENANYFEWIYEEMELENTLFPKIYRLLNLEELQTNILKQQFEKEIALLDVRMKPFLKDDLKNNPNWKKDFDLDKLIYPES